MKHLFSLFIVFVFCSFLGYSQVTTATPIIVSEDSQTNSASPTATAGTATLMRAQVTGSGSSIMRSFLKFNLSSIPPNVVILSAKLKITPVSTENVTAINGTELTIEACNSTWAENSLNYNSNIVGNTFVSPIAISNLVSGRREFELRDHVQAMLDGRIPNNGWRIRRTNETVNNTSGYQTKEAADKDPSLVIQYYTKSSVSAAAIVHTSTLSSTDGSISPTIIGGGDGARTYRWYNSSGTQIGTSQNLLNVGKGWYGLKYYTTTPGDTTYQAFIVGTECETTTLTFDPGPNYIDDAQLMDRITGSGSTAVNYGQSNNGSVSYIMDERWTTGTWNNERGLLRFRLWVDPNCQVNTATLKMAGNSHNPSQITNASELLKVTSKWFENNVANTIAPTSTATGKINIAGIAAGNSNLGVDISSFLNDWKVDNTQNFGLLLQLQSYTSNSNTRMQFHSSDATVSNNRPSISNLSITTNTCDLKRKGTTTVTYPTTNDYADVTTNINAPSWAVQPYHYMISEQPIPNFSSIYHTAQTGDPTSPFKDTIYIDSTIFYNNGISASSKLFTEIEPGQYFVSVFDKLGKRIYDQQVSVNPAANSSNFELTSNISSTFLNDELVTTAAGGKALMYSFINEKSEGASISFKVSNNSGETLLGLLNLSSNLATKTDLVHGFIINGSLASIVSSGFINPTFAISPTDEFVLTKEGSTMKFYVNGVFKLSTTLPSTFTYKTGILGGSGGTPAGGVRIRYRPIKVISFKKAWINITEIKPGSCMGSFGKITGTLNSFVFFSGSVIPSTTVLTNVASGIAQTMDIGSTNISFSFSNLIPGTYTLTTTFAWSTSPSVPVVITTTVVVPTKVSWQNLVNATDIPAGSLLSTSGSNGYATSVNELLPVGSNTNVDFEVRLGGYILMNFGGFNFLVPVGNGVAYLGLTEAVPSGITSSSPNSFSGWKFYKTGLSPYYIIPYQGGNPLSSPISFLGTDRFRFVYTPSDNKGKLYKLLTNGSLGAQIGPEVAFYYTPGGTIVKKLLGYLATNVAGRGFINFSTNMLCPTEIIYAKMERQLLGVKYKVNLNKFYFFYDEEYASTASLTYNVYDKNNNVVLKTSILNLVNTVHATDPVTGNLIVREYGDNRYSLDVSSLVAGSYVLEVINEKEEKLYLRFIK